MQYYQWHNGTLNPSTAVMDERAFAYGDGFFSTIGVYAGRMICQTGHKMRLEQGALALSLRCDVMSVMQSLVQIAKQINEGMIKVIITRPVQAVRGYGFLPNAVNPMANNAQIFIKAMPSLIYQSLHWLEVGSIPVSPSVSVVRLDNRISHRPSRLAGLKLIGCIDQVLAHAELIERQQVDNGIGDGLIANVHGQLICATVGNIFYQLDGQWYTPPVDISGVAGVMRQAVITSRVFGDVSERILVDDDLSSIQAMCITNAVRGIVPVAMLDGQALSDLTEQINPSNC